MQTPNTVRIGLNPIATTVIHRTQVGRLSMASRALLGECGSPAQINRSEGASSHEIFTCAVWERWREPPLADGALPLAGGKFFYPGAGDRSPVRGWPQSFGVKAGRQPPAKLARTFGDDVEGRAKVQPWHL